MAGEQKQSELSVAARATLEETCRQFEEAWAAGSPPRIPDFLEGLDQELRPMVLRELLALDLRFRRKAGESPSAAEYLELLPNEAAIVEEVFAETDGGRSIDTAFTYRPQSSGSTGEWKPTPKAGSKGDVSL